MCGFYGHTKQFCPVWKERVGVSLRGRGSARAPKADPRTPMGPLEPRDPPSWCNESMSRTPQTPDDPSRRRQTPAAFPATGRNSGGFGASPHEIRCGE